VVAAILFIFTGWCNVTFGFDVLLSFVDSGENWVGPVDFFFVPQCVHCDPAGLFSILLFFLAIDARQKTKNNQPVC